MRIDDLIILGRASPDVLSDNRVTVCTAGYSNTIGFVRIYPTKRDSPLNRWNIVSVAVDRDPRDTRNESWKIEGSKREWDRLNGKITLIGDLKQSDKETLITNHVDGCVHDINEDKRSLGIIKPTEIGKGYFGKREGYNPHVQTTLLDKVKLMGKKNFPLVPRIQYRCSNCRAKGYHDQQVIDWGFYEWIRKNPNNINQVWENAKISNSNSEIYFLVGNQMLHRTSYMIISVFSFTKETPNPNQMTL